jgi:tetratricopeptide (TPR) repeat protein
MRYISFSKIAASSFLFKISKVINLPSFFLVLILFTTVVSARTNSLFPIDVQDKKIAPDEVQHAVEYLQKNRLPEAIELLQKATKQNINDADAWQYLGIATFRAGNIEVAKQAFEKAISLRSDVATSHTGLASCFLALNKTTEAEKELRLALKIHPRSDEARYFLSAIKLKLEDFDNAVIEADNALEINPAFKEALSLKNLAIFEIFSRVIDPNFRIDKSFEREQALNYMLFGMTPNFDNSKTQFKISQAGRFNHALEVFNNATKKSPNTDEFKKWQSLIDSINFWKPWLLDLDKKPLSSELVQLNKTTIKPKLLKVPEVTNLSTQIDTITTLLVIVTPEGTILNPLFTLPPYYGLAPLILSIVDKITLSPAQLKGKPVTTMTVLRIEISRGHCSVSIPEQKK